ncbi:MAG TPA: hypothetical protein DCR40_07320 [Prolixibacteraceae bacterium]|nr:hypothetical protein [Prolixibacteraceae bacterium]
MKKLFILSAILTFSLFARSQQKIEVEIEEKGMSKGLQMSISMIIPESKPKDVEPIWKQYVNNRGIGERLDNLATQIGNAFKSNENQVSRDKLKVEKKGDELYVRSIEQSSITNHSMDIYARLSEMPNGCQFSAFFQYTDSIFINESNVDQERIQNLKSYIHEFGVEAYKSVVDDQIKEAKKVVSRQEDVKKDFESDSRKEEKAIARFESDIQELNAGIFEVESAIVRLNENITAKEVKLTTITKKTPEYDAAKKELKELAKEKSNLFSKNKSFKSKIKSKESDITSAKNRIAGNELKMEIQKKVIQEKELIVLQLIAKKERIQ